MNKVLLNIRKNNLLYFIPNLLFSIICSLILFLLSYMINKEEKIIWLLLLLSFFAYTTFILLKNVLYYGKLVIFPKEAPVFKKYGSPEEITKILDEIDNTIEYEDKHLIISKNYISDKCDYSKIIHCDDILGIHKLIHKTNFVTDYYQIVLIDKYGEEITYKYKRSLEEKVNNLLIKIASKCKNAELGYTSKEREYIKKNIVPLPTKVKERTTKKTKKVLVEYKCPSCKKTINYKDKYCKECGFKIDWSK